MTIYQVTAPSNRFKQVEQEFRDFLMKRGEALGFSESKRDFWASYMMDISRSKKVIEDFFDEPKTKLRDNHRALDIGCGCGNLMIALQPYFDQVCGIDINQHYVEWAQKRAARASVVYGNAVNLPWSDEWFDLVCATDMFEHVEFHKQEEIASELMRVLKPGGWGIVMVPNRFQLLDEHNRVPFGTWLPSSKREFYVKALSKSQHYDHCWERTGTEWKQLFEKQGFEVILEPHYLKGWNFLRHFLVVPPNRYKLYIRKPDSTHTVVNKRSHVYALQR